jgi:hypothetical protein
MNLIYSIPVTSTWMLVVFVGAVGAVFIAALIKERKRRGS